MVPQNKKNRYVIILSPMVVSLSQLAWQKRGNFSTMGRCGTKERLRCQIDGPCSDIAASIASLFQAFFGHYHLSDHLSEFIAEYFKNVSLYRDRKKPWQPETWGCTHFSPPGNRAIFSTFWGHFLTKLHSQPGEKGKPPLEKIQKNPVEKAPQNCRFLSLVMVERVLTVYASAIQ